MPPFFVRAYNGEACRKVAARRFLQSDLGTRVRRVDSRGSRILQARVALGGKVGALVTLLSTEEPHLLAKIGEAGEVTSLNDDGTVTVHWDRGEESSIDVLNTRVEVHP